MSNPISRLELARHEIDRTFGDGYARTHPELVSAVMQSAASDFAAACIAGALERSARLLADALAAEDWPAGAIIREQKLMRP